MMTDERFERLLRERIGLDAASIGSASIERAVRERVLALTPAFTPSPEADAGRRGAASGFAGSTAVPLTQAQRDAYWLHLCESEDEQQHLVEAVVVPETWFFRDREAFVALAKLARERHARWPDRTLRVVSLPCSTGEEPYSIAMALLDAGLPAGTFTIDAFDISARSLAHAARARYGRNAFRGHALEFRDHHFTIDANTWKLRDDVCATVRFARVNLFDPAIRARGPYDFVFCRNVLIYFDKDDQARAVDVLEQLLAHDGTLFVGPSETGALFRHAMQSARIPLAFAFHKTSAPPVDRVASLHALRTPLTGIASATHAPAAAVPVPRPTDKPATDAGARGHVVAGNTAAAAASASPASTQRAGAIKRAPTDASMRASLNTSVNTSRGMSLAGSYGTSAVRSPAPSTAPTSVASMSMSTVKAKPSSDARTAGLADVLRLADAGRLADATLAADAHLGTYGPSAEVFYLLGLIADADGRTADAAGLYRKTLYLDPSHYEALTHLSTLLESQGDAAGAQRLAERAARANIVRVSGHG
ncbi:MAG TPA: protein-glutamate O-methyltransferase CheR [Pararobbsia sp.]|nr:protein-glutamate O-methyltransferase CheR [Pararobbsia sp.]